MKIKCPQCDTAYQVPNERIPEDGVHTRCKKCQAQILVQRQPPPAPSENPPNHHSTQASPAGDPNEVDRQLQQFVDQGNEAAAAEWLLDRIVAAAKNKDFSMAESLRDKLYDAAPTALSEIVKAGEIIEEEKSRAMDPAHLDRWKNLYERLTAEERNELYFAMQPLSVTANQTVYQQGAFHAKLYFVQAGTLTLLIDNPEIQKAERVKNVTAGDVANITPFFSYSVCTASLVATVDSQLTSLDKTVLSKWAQTFPGIETPLYVFCQSQGTAVDLAKKSGLTIRAHRRLKTSVATGIQLLDKAGKPVQKPFRVSLADISAGGLCFSMKLNRKQEANNMLGHRLLVQLLVPGGESPQKIRQLAQIVAVHIKPFGGASVHVRFDHNLEPQVIKRVEISG